MTQSRLGTLDESLLDIGNTEGSLVGRSNLVVNDRGKVQSNVVLGHANLAWNFDDLNLDVDSSKVLTERVDFDQTGIDGALEARGVLLAGFQECVNVEMAGRYKPSET